MARTVFTGGLRPYPGLRPEHRGAAAEVLERVALALEASGKVPLILEPVEGADYEDFWEDACRMAAAHRATGGDLLVADHTELRPTDKRLGPVASREEGNHAVDDLLMHPVARSRGGRDTALVGVSPDDPAARSATAWMAERAALGHELTVLKSTEFKKGVHVVPVSTDPAANDAALMEALGWEYVRLEGLPGTLLAQDWVPMTWETRFFVVDGRVVTSAGCVEEATPLDRGLAPFQMRELRGHHRGQEPSPVGHDVEALALLSAFADEVAAEYGGTVTIDCAINAETGSPLVVELNPIHNSGLYACDHWALFEALATANSTGYPVLAGAAWD